MRKKIAAKEQAKSTLSVVGTYMEEIEYTCPVRGKVKQLVKIQRIESVNPNVAEDIKYGKQLADKLDQQHSGLLLNDDVLDEED